MARVVGTALLLLIAAACSDRPPTPAEQLARFPGAGEVNSQETLEIQIGRPLPAFLTPAPTWIGHGLDVPVGPTCEDGSRATARVGVWTFRYVTFEPREQEQGLMATGAYEQGQKTGPWRLWYPDGGRLAEGAFLEGRLHGDWTVWTASGEVDDARSGRYERGERVGPGVGFAASGSVLTLLAAAAGVALGGAVAVGLIVRRRRRRRAQPTA
jgi:hypothetical protein